MAVFRQTLSSEWHKQRWILYGAISLFLLCNIVFGSGWITSKNADIDPRFIDFSFFWIWLIVGSAAGALVFAKGPGDPADSESQGCSIRIMLLKLSVGLAPTFLSCMFLSFAAHAYREWDFRGQSYLSCLTVFRRIYNDVSPFVIEDLVLEKIMAGFFLAFASSLLFSAVSRRVFTSAVSSLAITSLLFFGTAALWHRLDLSMFQEKSIWMIANISVAAFIVLGISFHAKIRCSRTGHSIRGILSGAISISLMTVLLFGCLALLYLRTSIKDLQLSSLDIKVSPTGRYVLTNAMSDKGNPRLLVLPVNQKQGRPLILRNAFYADFSPHGNWITYFSHQNWLGLVSDSISLRACRTDGSDDRVLIPDFAEWDILGEHNPHDEMIYDLIHAISSDGNRVAFNYGSFLYVASLDGHKTQKVQLSSAFGSSYRMVGFHPNGAEVLLFSFGKDLIACNLIEGKCRVQLKAGQMRKAWYLDYASTHQNQCAVQHILFGYQLFNIESSTMRLLPDRGKDLDFNDYSLLGADVSRDQRTLVYAVRSDSDSANSPTRIHTYAIESGSDEIISTIPERVHKLLFSPTGNSLAIACRGTYANDVVESPSKVAIMQSKKLIQSFTGWKLAGWASESEVILIQDDGLGISKPLAIGDIVTGNTRQLFP